jgi:hypothetical protein
MAESLYWFHSKALSKNSSTLNIILFLLRLFGIKEDDIN